MESQRWVGSNNTALEVRHLDADEVTKYFIAHRFLVILNEATGGIAQQAPSSLCWHVVVFKELLM